MSEQPEELAMDLSRSVEDIYRDLRARWPRVVDLWFELEDDDRSGLVFNHNRVLAKLVQS